MQSAIYNVVTSLFPEAFQEIPMYEPFINQLTANAMNKLREELTPREGEKAYDEDDKQGIMNNFVYEMRKEVSDGLGEEEAFSKKHLPMFENLTIPKNDVVVPVYRVRLSKKTGGKKNKKRKAVLEESKAINPRTGSKVSMKGRVFRVLVKEGLLTQEGKFTEEGQDAYDTMQSKKPKKIVHPSRAGGKINLGGTAFKTLVKEGWSYDEESNKWTDEREDQEATEEIEEPLPEEGSSTSSGFKPVAPRLIIVQDPNSSATVHLTTSGFTSQEEEKPQEEEAEEEKPQEAEEKPQEVEADPKGKEPEEWEIPEERLLTKGPRRGMPAKPEAEPKKTSSHPTRNRRIILGGRAFKKLHKEGWTYNEDEDTWLKNEDEDAENDE
uniref:Uncharacterized protein n=1 Tax=Pithovirus LCPAC304 TaxID=2506594 RepID=A0A481ZBB6_9VIRU|nr:MAG: hypothetical protein LCPAC304_03040 [Pithovirus LCPAC304]